MARIKSGLEGARRAVRRLFGRQASPAGNSNFASGTSGTSTGNDDLNLDSDAAGPGGSRRPEGEDSDGHLSPSTAESSRPVDTNSRQSGKDEDKGVEEQAGDDSSATKYMTTTRGHDISTNDTMTAALDPQNNQGSYQQSKMEQKHASKENQSPVASGPGSDNENQPPGDAFRNTLISPMKKRALAEHGDNVPEAKQIGDEAGILTPEKSLTEEEKAIRAEREKHLVFIEEALDMVSTSLFPSRASLHHLLLIIGIADVNRHGSPLRSTRLRSAASWSTTTRSLPGV